MPRNALSLLSHYENALSIFLSAAFSVFFHLLHSNRLAKPFFLCFFLFLFLVSLFNLLKCGIFVWLFMMSMGSVRFFSRLVSFFQNGNCSDFDDDEFGNVFPWIDERGDEVSNLSKNLSYSWFRLFLVYILMDFRWKLDLLSSFFFGYLECF